MRRSLLVVSDLREITTRAGREADAHRHCQRREAGVAARVRHPRLAWKSAWSMSMTGCTVVW